MRRTRRHRARVAKRQSEQAEACPLWTGRHRPADDDDRKKWGLELPASATGVATVARDGKSASGPARARARDSGLVSRARRVDSDFGQNHFCVR